ncbi:MAG TPA: methyltransferase domain-containing protein [Pyrinomonadaceae bacterium]|jgi:SAM-dependent methyltransferase|nr:methyltransferase domain-containing protein [Pyrinomonadaceae bacterium]
MAVSFRDPAGALLSYEGRILRLVNKQGEGDINAALASQALRGFVDSGHVVKAWPLAQEGMRELLGDARLADLVNNNQVSMVVEHERIPFQSFPYEWPPEMLHRAARLTLDLGEAMLAEGRGLKDATPYNVLFRGPKPVFVDWLSFEPRDPADSTWLPYAQFARTFLLPLLVNKHFGLQLGPLLLQKRDGLEPEEVYRLSGWAKRLRLPFLTLATIPTHLGAKQGSDTTIYQRKTEENVEKARFILEQQFKRLRRLLKRVEPDAASASAWADYMGAKQHFTDEYLQRKEAFVKSALEEFKPEKVLDIGCNTGYFSGVAARAGARVVAIDQDPIVVGSVWRMAEAENLDVLPLVVDITRPSPGVGWRNEECLPFLDRARHQSDAVMMLAVIHHMLVSERIPLPEILELAAELTENILIIEFVGTDDPMFQRITRGREHLYAYLTREFFELNAHQHFNVLRSQEIEPSRRWIYLLQRK